MVKNEEEGYVKVATFDVLKSVEVGLAHLL